MAEVERLSEWVERWGESQWNSAEWRDFLLRCLRDWEIAEDRLSEIEPIYEKQIKYIVTLERQIELLQKTLDLAEKFAPPSNFYSRERRGSEVDG